MGDTVDFYFVSSAITGSSFLASKLSVCDERIDEFGYTQTFRLNSKSSRTNL